MDLVPLEGHLVGVLGLGPEVGNGESLVKVCAEVVHDADREHDVHAELYLVSLVVNELVGKMPGGVMRLWIEGNGGRGARRGERECTITMGSSFLSNYLP